MHSFRLHLLNNPVTTRNALLRSNLSTFVADALIRLESLVEDVHVYLQAHRLNHMPMIKFRI